MLRPLHIHLILLFAMVLFSHSAQAQWKVSAGVHRGSIWQQSVNTGHLINNHPQGVHFSLSTQPKGDKAWHHAYRFPELGLSYRSFITGNTYLGNVHSLAPHLNFKLSENKKSNWLIATEMGLGYATNPFDPKENNQNMMLGTRLNYMVQGGLMHQFQLSPSWQLQTQWSLVHFSNANFRLPNKSLNIFYAQGGLAYRIQEKDASKLANIVTADPLASWSFNLLGTVGWNGATPYDRSNYPSYHWIAYAAMRLNSKSNLHAGIDYFHNIGTRQALLSNWYFREVEKPDFRKIGLQIGHGLDIGKLCIITHLGVYIYQPLAAPSPLYSRLGLQYSITENIIINMTVKFHKGQSEVAEWGLGYRIFSKK